MIVGGSLRQLPYSLRVDGRQTYIVGYAFTPTGVEEPTVGNDWYPQDLDVYDNQEFASVDAYIASEEGQATLQGCGVSALVPLATATQRLADNGINITVHSKRGLYNRDSGGSYGLVVDSKGAATVVTMSGKLYALRFATAAPDRYTPIDPDNQTIAALMADYGQGPNIGTLGSGQPLTCDGINYTVTSQTDDIILTPALTAWT